MLPLLPFERLSKKAGVKRISRDALEELRDIVTEETMETAEKAVKISRHANRRTVMREDIAFIRKT